MDDQNRKRTAPSILNTQVYDNFKMKEQIKSLRILSLSGIQSTGKSTILNNVIEKMVKDTQSFVPIDQQRWDFETINNLLDLKKDEKFIGDKEDQIAIFDQIDKNNKKRIGIVTSGDTTNIVSAGLQYLIQRKVDLAIIANHPYSYTYFITKLQQSALQIKTQRVDKGAVKDLETKNAELIYVYLKHVNI